MQPDSLEPIVSMLTDVYEQIDTANHYLLKESSYAADPFSDAMGSVSEAIGYIRLVQQRLHFLNGEH